MLSQPIGLLASQLQLKPSPADMTDLADSTWEMADIHRRQRRNDDFRQQMRSEEQPRRPGTEYCDFGVNWSGLM